MSAPSAESLAAILGVTFWSAEFSSAAAAARHAASRMAAGRAAVNWSTDGRHFAAWGVRL